MVRADRRVRLLRDAAARGRRHAPHLLPVGDRADQPRHLFLVSSDRGRTFTGSRLHEWDINACPMTSMSIAEQGARVLGAWETDGQVYFTDLAASAAARVPPHALVPAPEASTSCDRQGWPRADGVDRNGAVFFLSSSAPPLRPTTMEGRRSPGRSSGPTASRSALRQRRWRR